MQIQVEIHEEISNVWDRTRVKADVVPLAYFHFSESYIYQILYNTHIQAYLAVEET